MTIPRTPTGAEAPLRQAQGAAADDRAPPAAPSLHRTAPAGAPPEVRPTRALLVTAGLLALWAGVTVGAGPVSDLIAAVLTRVELHVIEHGLPWTR